MKRLALLSIAASLMGTMVYAADTSSSEEDAVECQSGSESTDATVESKDSSEDSGTNADAYKKAQGK